MPRLKILSSKDVIKILESFNFKTVSQKGSHIKQASKYISESELLPHFYNK